MHTFQTFFNKLLVLVSSLVISFPSFSTHISLQSPEPLSSNYIISPSVTPKPVSSDEVKVKQVTQRRVNKAKKPIINRSETIDLSTISIPSPLPKPTPTPKPILKPNPTPKPTPTPKPILKPNPTPKPSEILVEVLLLGINRCPKKVIQIFELDHDFMLTYKMEDGNQMSVNIKSGSLELANHTLKEKEGVLATLPYKKKYTITLQPEKCPSHQDNWFWLYYKRLD